jgi:hypothetical protein
VQRALVVGVGLLAAAVAATLGYGIGVRITAPWLGVVMALNSAVLAGVLAAWSCERICDRLWSGLRRQP